MPPRLLALLAFAALALRCSPAPAADALPSATVRELHSASQAERTARGLAPQQLDPTLCSACQAHAEWMAAGGGLRHGSSDNVIAWGTSTPEATVAMWLGSPPHRAHLLGGTSRAGWGHAVDRAGRHWWAGAFRGTTTPTVSVQAPRVTVSVGPSQPWRWRRR